MREPSGYVNFLGQMAVMNTFYALHCIMPLLRNLRHWRDELYS